MHSYLTEIRFIGRRYNAYCPSIQYLRDVYEIFGPKKHKEKFYRPYFISVKNLSYVGGTRFRSNFRN